MRAAGAIAFWPRHEGAFPISPPLDSHVRYAEIARTSGVVGVGSSSADRSLPVAFSLRRKQSVTRSPRLKSRPDRRLYSGNIVAMFTSGIDFSRCPAFM